MFVVAGANLAFESLGDSLGPCVMSVYVSFFLVPQVILGEADICKDVCVCVYRVYPTIKELKHPETYLQNGRSNLFLKPNHDFDLDEGELNLFSSPMIHP